MDGADKNTRERRASHYTSTVCVSVCCLNYVNENKCCMSGE